MQDIVKFLTLILVSVFLISSLTVTSAMEIVDGNSTGSILKNNSQEILGVLSANFSSNVTNGSAPLNVQFADRSTKATAWNWSFGDGNSSTLQSPVHTYYLAGNYTVNLTVSNENNTNSKAREIIVHKALSKNKNLLVANFTSNVTGGYAPLSVQFADSSQNATVRSWDFNNDGVADSSDLNPIYTYTVPGIYTVKLIVNNTKGGNASKKSKINVQAVSTSGGSSKHSSGNSHNSGSIHGSGSSRVGSSHSSSNSRGSGSSGSVGNAGSSPEPQNNVKAKEIFQSDINSRDVVKIDFKKNATSVVYVSFNSRIINGKTTTIVEMLKRKSTLASGLPSGKINNYLNIWIGNSGFATPNNIENAIVCFKVEKSWISDKKINQSSIILSRYNNNKWDPLPTSKSGEDDNYLYLITQTPEFSQFAITGNTIENEDMKKIQPEAKNKPVMQDIRALKALQTHGLDERSKLLVFGMICLIALLIIAFIF